MDPKNARAWVLLGFVALLAAISVAGCGSPYYIDGQDELGELPDSLRVVIEEKEAARRASRSARKGRDAGEGVFVREVGTEGRALPLEYKPDESYLLRRGDRVEIRVLFYPELTTTTWVRPDGMVTAPGVGDVLALGRRPSEVAADVEAYYSTLLRDPATTVNVTDFGARRAYVFGQVEKPGPIDLESRMTLTQALSATGSPTDEAKLASVVLIRRRSESSAQAYRLDLRGVLAGKSLAADVVLRPDDVVYVPKSFIASMATFVDQLFDGLQPIPQLVISSYDAIHVDNRIPARR